MAERDNKKQGNRPPNQMMLRRTLVLMIVCGISAFIVLGVRLFILQIIQHEKYESAAIEQQVRETTLTSSRGAIYDTNGKILAMSATAETIYISPAEIAMYDEDPQLIAKGLSEILNVDYNKVLEMTSDTKSWYKTVARKVEEDTADLVRQFKNEYNLKGVRIENDTKRYYPYGDLASHVIGFVGYENTGLLGIELSLDGVLTGTNGRIVRAKNARGTDMLFTKFEDYYDSEDGNSIVLTVDSTIQYYVEKHLQQAVEDYGVQDGAAAICMNVNTGEILAMASIGNFDLNNYQLVSEDAQAEIDKAETDEERKSLLAKAQNLQWRNKAVEDSYEPGSTFKIITLAMALEEGAANVNDGYYCGGSITVQGDSKPRKCWKTQGHGSQTLTQSVQHSCNVAFIQIGQKIGAETFYEYVDAFGFREDTGIELVGEGASLWWGDSVFFDPDNKSQLAAASFGQTFTITPMQLITAVSACANGGYLMQPYIVKEIHDDDGNIISKTEPKVRRQVISEETSEKVCSILEQVVCDTKEGTGKNAYVAGYRIAGKTGTSTDTVQEAQSGNKEYIVSFIGFAPADDPEIAILVLLDKPDNSCGVYVSGGNMGAPTVGAMMADILPYMGVEAVYTEDELALMDKSAPSVVGMSIEQAKAKAAELGFGWRIIGEGENVTMQLPAANSIIAAGSELIFYCDAEPSEELEEMPDLAGLTYEVARQRLAYYGLYIKTDGYKLANSNTIVVSTQSVEAGTQVEHGTIISVELVDKDTSVYGRY